MNFILEQKIKDLLDEAEQQGAPAAFMVLHLLLGNYHNGTQHQFAQHCCQFSPLGGMQIEVSPPEKSEDHWADWDSGNYYH